MLSVMMHLMVTMPLQMFFAHNISELRILIAYGQGSR